jgi:nucleoside-diphosphate-sugar epimerase
MWIQYLIYLYKKDKVEQMVEIPRFYYNKKTSYVYVKDVARVCNILLTSSAHIRNEIFNLGKFLLSDLKSIINHKKKTNYI